MLPEHLLEADAAIRLETKRHLHPPAFESSAIDTFYYNTSNKVLEVTFESGETYRYFDVPRSLFTQFKESDSKGKFFQANIRNHFDFGRFSTGQKQGENATSQVSEWGETVKRFHLQRNVDESGVSGTGYVAEGVELRNGMAVLWWVAGEVNSVVTYKDIGEVEKIHGHGGFTKVVWE